MASAQETNSTDLKDSRGEKSRGLIKFQEGVVVSDKMDKSIVVKVTTHKMHPKYKKFLLSSKKYHAHDEKNQCGIGDIVKIVETRPLSKKKRWKLQSLVKKAL